MEISETIPNTGVDPKTVIKVGLPWLMVPVKGYSWFTLHDAGGLTVVRRSGRVSVHKLSDANERVLRTAFGASHSALMKHRSPWRWGSVFGSINRAQTKRDDVYFVRGLGPGPARLLVRGGGTRETIDVDVHAPRTVTLTLHRVMHRPGGGPYTSHGRHSKAQLNTIAEVAKSVLAPQTNVTIVHKVQDLRFDGDLGDLVDFWPDRTDGQLDDFRRLAALGDQHARLKAYAVDEYAENGVGQGNVSKHTFKTHPRNIIFSTGDVHFDLTRLGQILAHEICHAMLHPRGSIPAHHVGRGLMHGGRLLGYAPISHQDLKLYQKRTRRFYRNAM